VLVLPEEVLPALLDELPAALLDELPAALLEDAPPPLPAALLDDPVGPHEAHHPRAASTSKGHRVTITEDPGPVTIAGAVQARRL
jgi:hypothetical protein